MKISQRFKIICIRSFSNIKIGRGEKKDEKIQTAQYRFTRDVNEKKKPIRLIDSQPTWPTRQNGDHSAVQYDAEELSANPDDLPDDIIRLYIMRSVEERKCAHVLVECTRRDC